MRKIGILTGGGDCPGLNAVIRGVVARCMREDIAVFGFYAGWRGVLEMKGAGLPGRMWKASRRWAGQFLAAHAPML